MDSLFDLLDKDRSELYALAQEVGLEGRGSMSKAELQAALAEEDLREGQVGMLKASKSELKSEADRLGVEVEGSAKATYQKRLLVESGVKRPVSVEGPERGSAGTEVPHDPYPDAAVSPDKKRPRGGLESHYDTAEAREEAAREAARRATECAFQDRMSYVAIESLRPKDESEPMKVQPSYMQRHPDTIVVYEARVPRSAFPILGADSSSVRL